MWGHGLWEGDMVSGSLVRYGYGMGECDLLAPLLGHAIQLKAPSIPSRETGAPFFWGWKLGIK
jgi:hypothetical protein